MRRSRRKLDDGRGGSVSAIVAVPDDHRPGRTPVVVLAHGAGNDMESSFLATMESGLVAAGIAVVRFNFPFKERGGKAPDARSVLEKCVGAVLEQVRTDKKLGGAQLIAAGKSMGGRMASYVVAKGAQVDGLVFFGYPLHPPGRPEKERSDQFPDLAVPTLFLQGTRDSLCDLDRLRPAIKRLNGPCTLHVIEDGDHSFKVLKRTGRPPEEVEAELVSTAAAWIHRVAK